MTGVIANLPRAGYREVMADVLTGSAPVDPLVSAEGEVDVDQQTAAAIQLGIEAADANLVVSSEEVRKLVPLWISRLSTPSPR